MEKDRLYTKEDGKIPFGILIWATGNKQVPFVDRLPVLKSARLPRILTDVRRRVFSPDNTLIGAAYALSDAADVKGGEFPTTAEVTCQKAEYLARAFNSDFQINEAFTYSQRM